MRHLKYPIGIQSFQKIIEEGYAYVDKTALIGSMVREGAYYFLSRPRRFGKSLLVSTMQAYFEGRRNLFQGLDIDSMDVEWKASPVLHFDFNAENFTVERGLEHLLDTMLYDYEEIYGRRDVDVTPAQRFRTLIRKASEQTGSKVVILIDEYDKPLLGIEENKELFERNQAVLKSFFANLKTMDSYIRFAFLTGVARFNKVSIFSDLNNLDDISLADKYADICGWTEKELTENFREGIEDLASNRGETYSATLDTLRAYYDGYKFSDRGSRLYNPFSVLSALKKQRIEPYWFETGTPTFLAKRVKASGIDPATLNNTKSSRRELLTVGIGTDNPVALMFQTGYLTIDTYDSQLQRYLLRFPNREVEIGFAQYLVPLYIPSADIYDSPFGIDRFKEDLYSGNPDEFMHRLKILFKDLPYEDHCESTYRAVVYLLCTLCSTQSEAEHHSYRGRSDLEVYTPDYIYVFEFKFNMTAHQAMAQIIDRDYAGHLAADGRKIFLIGANINSRKTDNILSYEIREYS